MLRTLTAPALLLLAACGSDNAAETLREDPSQALNEAAAQSGPAAANVLENAAARMEGRDTESAAAARNALENAADAQAETLPPALEPGNEQ